MAAGDLDPGRAGEILVGTLAALFHDIGKSRVPIDILNKADVLTDEEWRHVAAHPWLGVLALFQLKEQQELEYKARVGP